MTDKSRRHSRQPSRAHSRSQGPTRDAPKHQPVHLSDDIVRELHATVRPGKGDILVKVFGEAAGALAEGDLDTAIELGDQAKHMALRSPAVREFLGLAYYHAGRYQEAATELGAFRRIAGTTEQNPVIADCYRALDKPQKALELCDEIEAAKVGAAVYYEGSIVAASVLADLGRLDEAIARLEALDLSPANAEEHHLRAWYVLGDLLERRGRFTQAREWFDAVEAADPGLTDAGSRSRRLARL